LDSISISTEREEIAFAKKFVEFSLMRLFKVPNPSPGTEHPSG